MDLQKLFEVYREQGVPQDQQMLIALLREVQETLGGTLTEDVLFQAASFYGMKATLLQALIKRVPDLRMANAAHWLEMCASCKAGYGLRAWLEDTYGVKSGGSSEKGGFTYRTTPCMKNCKNGPSVRWDGTLYSHADQSLLIKLIEEKA